MLIPVMRKMKTDDEEIKIEMLDINDVWYVSVDARQFVAYHTAHETFYQPTKMEQVLAFLKHHHFEKLDRGMVVNIENIKHFDEEYGKVFFEEEISNESKFATVSYSKIKKLQSILHANGK